MAMKHGVEWMLNDGYSAEPEFNDPMPPPPPSAVTAAPPDAAEAFTEPVKMHESHNASVPPASPSPLKPTSDTVTTVPDKFSTTDPPSAVATSQLLTTEVACSTDAVSQQDTATEMVALGNDVGVATDVSPQTAEAATSIDGGVPTEVPPAREPPVPVPSLEDFDAAIASRKLEIDNLMKEKDALVATVDAKRQEKDELDVMIRDRKQELDSMSKKLDETNAIIELQKVQMAESRKKWDEDHQENEKAHHQAISQTKRSISTPTGSRAPSNGLTLRTPPITKPGSRPTTATKATPTSATKSPQQGSTPLKSSMRESGGLPPIKPTTPNGSLSRPDSSSRKVTSVVQPVSTPSPAKPAARRPITPPSTVAKPPPKPTAKPAPKAAKPAPKSRAGASKSTA